METEVTSCQPPLSPVNGRVIASTSSSPGHFKAGDYVDFVCNPGFIGIWEESGSSGSMSICLPNGSWSQSPPDCESLFDHHLIVSSRVCLFVCLLYVLCLCQCLCDKGRHIETERTSFYPCLTFKGFLVSWQFSSVFLISLCFSSPPTPFM